MTQRQAFKWLWYLALVTLPIWGAHMTFSGFSQKTAGQFAGFFSWIPYLLFGLTAFLGSKLNQTRIFYSAISLIIAYWVVVTFHGNNHNDALRAAAFALPLASLLIAPAKEVWIWSAFSGLQFGISLIPWLLSLSWLEWKPSFLGRLMYARFIPGISATNLPHVGFLFALISFFVWLGFQAYRKFYTVSFSSKTAAVSEYFGNLLAGWIPLFLVFGQWSIARGTPFFPENWPTILAFTACGLLVLASMYHLYWVKVYLDELTAVSNRRALDERLPQLGKRFAIAMIDIDHFKKFNDTYGHETGDQVLRWVASFFSRGLGKHGALYRYGGEEFCVIFENYGAEEAGRVLNEIRESLAGRKFQIRRPDTERKKTSWFDRGKIKPSGSFVNVTVSVGVSDASANSNDTKLRVVERADEALYKAKEKGRNRVMVNL